ncbi:hypothetical protein CSW14_11335 [Thermus scotoductus]|uniref:Uncharacterized protein n=1 Tax=Thermus scotoductus TaxID=37636 RepID=A0A430VET0_THESC|nr:hypothetical protein CSW14_11335 [Thermus scotoductus]
MRRGVGVLLVFLLASFAPVKAGGGGGGNPFWNTLDQVLRTGCGYTYTFNFGSNWEWICSLSSIYKNIRWILDNISEYGQSMVFEMFTGVLEGTMQSLGLAIGPGVNDFVQEIDKAIRTVRVAPTKLRQAIARAMVEDAKQKYLNSGKDFPRGSGQKSLADKEDSSPTVLIGKITEFLRNLKRGLAVGGFTSGLAEANQKFEDSKKALKEGTQLATKMLTPKEAEAATGGVAKKGVADNLIDRARSAVSSREVLELAVEGIANLLKLEAAMGIATASQINQQLQAQLLSNSGLTALYDVLAEQAEQEAGDAEAALQVAAMAVDDVIRDSTREYDQIIRVFDSLSTMVDNVPNLGDYIE